MSVFDSYARYYDLLYRDKDYAEEVAFVTKMIAKYRPGAATLLELGCGTGRHAQEFLAGGFTVVGVDRSTEMLKQAAQRLSDWTRVQDRLRLVEGDIRCLRVSGTFDAVVSLFHVMSYQISNADLKAAFLSAWEHLPSGGIFMFDCWHGPAVLTDRPTTRVKRLADDAIEVVRIAEPEMLPQINSVDVRYQVLIRDKATRTVEELHEVHRMRYLFQTEIELVAEQTGFSLVEAGEWLTGQALAPDSWNAFFVCRK